MRLDLYLTEAELAKSRTKASELISEGYVSVDGKIITKPSYNVSEANKIEILGTNHNFVGRGGVKLEAALKRFNISVESQICADIGASTGGFTDCLLKHGAKFVYAIDSGHDQLDKSLAIDPRVKNIEGFNARFISSDTLPEKCNVIVSDVSFISQTLILPAVKNISEKGTVYLPLIKPQFECGRDAVRKGGIVKEKKQHRYAIEKVISSAVENGFAPVGLMKSAILGGDGNTEFMLYSVFGAEPKVTDKDILEAIHE